MRTTIEIPDELREQLLMEAAQRGEKGYSTIVERALRLYFQHGESEPARRASVRRLRGSMHARDAATEHERRAAVRDNWRPVKNA